MGRQHKALMPALIAFICLTVVALGIVVVRNSAKEGTSADRRVSLDHLRITIMHLASMEERASWEGQTATSLYLRKTLDALGVHSEFQTYSHEEKEWRNVVATLPGELDHSPELLAVAHYDSKNWNIGSASPGADDNASGVAVLLEAARLLRGIPHRSTIRLVFVSNEEHDDLGSKSFARQARQNRTDIRGVLNVDVVGYDAPFALFSLEPFTVLKTDVPLERKFRMLAKMASNVGVGVIAGRKSLKLMARSQDRPLAPVDSDGQPAVGFGPVRWELGSSCV